MKDELSLLFRSAIDGNADLQEAISVVRSNSEGGVWLVGGAVYRTLAKELYSTPMPVDVDFDFVVSSLGSDIVAPEDWQQTRSKLGGVRFINDRYTIDFWSLDMMRRAGSPRSPGDINDYLTGVPLTIQAIAFDLEREAIIGDTGIEALLKKTVGAHNHKELLWYSDFKGTAPNDDIQRKAESLRFRAEPFLEQ